LSQTFFINPYDSCTCSEWNVCFTSFFLLPNKETKSYFYSFKYLYDGSVYKIVGLTFSPKYIFIDFEKSIHNAAQQVWSTINIKGRFHLGINTMP